MVMTMLSFLILLHVAATGSTVAIKNDCLVTRALPCPCRRCKFYMKVGLDEAPTSVSALPESPSDGKKNHINNAGVVVGLSALLVLIIAALCACFYFNNNVSDASRVVASEVQPAEAQAVVLVETPVVTGGSQSSNNVGGYETSGNESNDEVMRPENAVVGQSQGDSEVEDVRGKKPLEEHGSCVKLPKRFTYKVLTKATNNFSVKNKIGGGGFGNVYKGVFLDGTVVAVKWLKCEGKIDDFKNEVEALGSTDHPNLVKLIGYCEQGMDKFLVYEFMCNGSLKKWIFHARRSRRLSWPEMKNVIQGIAEGLEYLHEKCDRKILHRDLKPQNVILDENKNAKLCDFGLAKLMNKDQSSTSTACAGTMRYMAPEVIRNKRITNKVDVYSFGIVVLEVLFGKRYQYLVNSDQSNNSDAIKLPDLIKNLSEDMRRNAHEIEEFGKLAKDCIREKPKERPRMSAVVAAIHDLEARSKES